ncbi:CMTA1 protein, partial [Polyodon spathula]|nr:CMTA1 protein [Polyodon spathula]
MSILERLEQMERRMAEMSSPHQQGAGGPAGGGGGGAGGNTSQAQCVSGPGQAGTSFESRVVVVCEKMMGRTCWAKSKHLIHSKTFRGMTLLHLAAAQGYGTLIQTLIKWRSEPSSYYSTECQRDLPLAKKHKPNPELFQPRPDKAMSVPLSLEQHQLRRHSLGGSDGNNSTNSSSGMNWSAKDFYSHDCGEQRSTQTQAAVSSLVSCGPVNMMTLAEQIIEATPERIKRESFVAVETTPLAEREDSAGVSNTMSWLASYLADVEQLPSLVHLRSLYSEPLAPSSYPSLSPASSPVSEGGFDKPTLPSAADWTEFLSASNNKVERELAQLTLSDPEQRELYEAARLVQIAIRKYKGRPLREQQEVAAAVIQRCYRKYKELTWIALKYALYKKMTQAAILIQSKFRSYHEQKKFQQSRRAAVLIQQYYRSYKELGRLRPRRRAAAALR